MACLKRLQSRIKINLNENLSLACLNELKIQILNNDNGKYMYVYLKQSM